MILYIKMDGEKHNGGEKMKKLNNHETRKIYGGAWYTTHATCEGHDANYNKWHSIGIEGKGITQAKMVADFNNNLRKHKTNAYYKQFTHSAKYL